MTHLHSKTPLIPSQDLANHLKVKQVYLKLDFLQPSGSFKIRGIGNQIQKALKAQPQLSTVVSSSGGNAGLAAAYAASRLGLACRVFVPVTTPAATIALLETLGATVTVSGSVWDETHLEAVRFLDALPLDSGLYVHPFEHPDLWEGHATIINEILADLDPLDVQPDVILCSVGGGGLITGILDGLIASSNKQKLPKVIGVETTGADSFATALRHGSPVELEAITSFAKSLGAKKISAAVLDRIHRYGGGAEDNLVRSLTVSDRQALDTLVAFADKFKVLVEPACAASLAPVFIDGLLETVYPELNSETVVVVEVCGGSSVSLEAIETWKRTIY